MRNEKATQVVFDDQMAFENAPQGVVSRRGETNENVVLVLEVMLNGRKMRFQLFDGPLRFLRSLAYQSALVIVIEGTRGDVPRRPSTPMPSPGRPSP